MKKNLYFGILASVAVLFTSCLGESDHNGQLAGYFTLNNSINESALYMDGGGVVYLSPSSDNTYKDFLSKSKRFNLVLSYPEEALVKDGEAISKITNADIVGGSYIRVSRPLSLSEAESRNITSKDSINDIIDYEFWVYGGYANIITSSVWLEKGGKGIEPTVNMVFEEVEDKPNELNLTFYNNWHSTEPAKESKPGQTDFINSFDITSLRNYLQFFNDDITLNIKVMKCMNTEKTEKTVKIKFEDLFYPSSN